MKVRYYREKNHLLRNQFSEKIAMYTTTESVYSVSSLSSWITERGGESVIEKFNPF
jgi:hypothetical protein